MSKTKRVKHPLLLGMVIYAVIFLATAAVGLRVFWDFIGAFEASRPENVIDEYIGQLTAAAIMLKTVSVFAYLPWLMICSLVCGLLIAVITALSISAFERLISR